MLNVSEGFKTNIKSPNAHSDGKVTISNDDLSNSLQFTRSNISKFNIYASAFLNEKVIGNIAQYTLTLELLGNQTKIIDLSTNKVAIPSIGVEVNGVYEYVEYQKFYINEVTYSDTTDVTKIVAVDSLIKLNINYIDSNIYPLSLKEYAIDAISQCGLELENDSFLNSDFVINSQPIQNNTSIKEVISRIAELALCFVMINKTSGKVEFVSAVKNYLTPITYNEMSVYTHDELSAFSYFKLMNWSSSTVDTIPSNSYWSLKLQDHSFGTHGVNTFVMKISNVEGENTSIVNEELFNIDGNVAITISDNPFVNSEELRMSVIEGLFAQCMTYKYLPFSLDYRGYAYLELGDVVTIIKKDTSIFDSPIYQTNITFNGSVEGNLSSPALSSVETAYQNTSTLRERVIRAEVLVDKVNGEITLLAADIDSVEVKLTDEVFNVRVQDITTDQYGKTISNVEKNFKFNIDGLEISSSENAFAVKIDEQELGFYDSGIKTAYINNSEFNINKGRIQSSLIVGPHKIENYENTMTLWRYIGE